MAVLIPALVPVAFIILIGYLVGCNRTLDRSTISQLALYALTPALVADTIYRTTVSGSSALRLTVGYILLMAALYGVAIAVGHLGRFPSDTRKSLLATTLFGNTGNMGLPLCAFAYGEAGLERAVVYFLASAIVTLGVGPALLAGYEWRKSIRLIFGLPLVWAMVAGALWRLSAIALPYNLDRGIEMLGAATIPVVLLLLGLQLAATPLAIGKYELLATGLRLCLGPAIAWGIGRVVGLVELDLQVFVLQSAMPAAVNTVILVGEFGGDAPRVARTIVLSTLLSFVTLSLVLGLSTGGL
ncbi:MAG: AEC family transporter [Cyanobacteria bacterium J06641_5]